MLRLKAKFQINSDGSMHLVESERTDTPRPDPRSGLIEPTEFYDSWQPEWGPRYADLVFDHLLND